MFRDDVHGPIQRRHWPADNLRNTRLRLHMSRRRLRQELPLLDEQGTNAADSKDTSHPTVETILNRHRAPP